MAPFSGGNDICHQRNDVANNVTATGGSTEYHLFRAAFLWLS
jgi:hypothetical protein